MSADPFKDGIELVHNTDQGTSYKKTYTDLNKLGLGVLELTQLMVVAVAKSVATGSQGRGFYSSELGSYGLYNVGNDEWCTSFADWCYVKAIEQVFGDPLSYDKKAIGELARSLTFPNGSTTACCNGHIRLNTYTGSKSKVSNLYRWDVATSPAVTDFSDNSYVGCKAFIGWPRGRNFLAVHTGILTYVGSNTFETVEGNTDGYPGYIKSRTGSSGFSSSSTYGKIVGFGTFSWSDFIDKLYYYGISIDEYTPPEASSNLGSVLIGKERYRPRIFTSSGWKDVTPCVYTGSGWVKSK